jgi:hypothetical protein
MSKLWIGLTMILVSSGAPVVAHSGPVDDLQRLTHRICPGHRLERLTDGALQDIFLDRKGPVFSAAVEQSLTGPERHFSRLLNCAKLASADCDVAARVSAIQSKGLLEDAARQVCRDWRCKDEATCTYSPPGGAASGSR